MKKTQPTDVVIVRHGIAVDIGENGVTTDGQRMLSDEGRTRTAESARGLKAIGCRPGIIFSSPLRRAVETAETIRDALGKHVEIEISDGLLPTAGPEQAVGTIAAAECATVMVVGHMPQLSILASFLLTGGGKAAIPLKKAGACSLLHEDAVAPGTAVLQWLLTPGMLRALGRTDG